jgi:hypothetical protein
MPSGSLSFGAVDIERRGTTGILLDNVDVAATFGAVTIPNQANAGGYGIRIQDSSGAKTFASATISNANVVTAQSDASGDGMPDTDGDGDAIFLKNNSGGFALNGGTLSNCGNDCIDARTSSAIALNGVTITSPGLDTTGATGQGYGGHGVSAMELTGTNSITGSTISAFDVGNRDGLLLVNTSGTTTITVTTTTFQNSLGNAGIVAVARGTSNVTLTVGSPAGSGSTFSNISASAIIANAADAATLNATIQRSTFQNSSIDGKTNVTGGGTQTSHATYTILNNTFNNVMKTASTGEGLISLAGAGDASGNAFAVTIQGNTISNVGANSGACAVGNAYCAGPLWAILITAGAAASVPSPIVVDGNVVTGAQQGGVKVDMANTGTGSSAVNAKITNNTFGTTAAPVGAGGTSVTVTAGIIVERRRNNSPAGNALISGNSVRNGNAAASLSTLNGPGIFVRTKANAHLDVTVTGNSVDTLSSNSVADMRFDSNANEVNDIVAPTQCDDITGNTFPAGAAALIDINEINGTHNVEQSSGAAVTAANGSSVAVTPDAGVSFGVACAAPPG